MRVLLGPPCRSLFWWKADPGGFATHLGLHVGLFGVGNLDGVAGCAADEVRHAAGLDGGWRAAEILEERGLVVLVDNPVALEDDAPLEFLPGVARGQFRVLLHADVENPAEVAFVAPRVGFLAHVVPVANVVLIPDSLVAQPLPLLVEGFACRWGAGDLFLADRPGDHGVEGHRLLHGYLGPMDLCMACDARHSRRGVFTVVARRGGQRGDIPTGLFGMVAPRRSPYGRDGGTVLNRLVPCVPWFRIIW